MSNPGQSCKVVFLFSTINTTVASLPLLISERVISRDTYSSIAHVEVILGSTAVSFKGAATADGLSEQVDGTQVVTSHELS